MANQTLTRAEAIVAARKNKALADCESVAANLNAHDDFRECQRNIRRAEVRIGLGCDAQTEKTLRAQINELQKKRLALLEKYGVKESQLRPNFHCKACNDEGYVGGERCKCLNKEIAKLLFADRALNKDFTFENSTESDEHNVKVYESCKKVCKKLDDGTVKNVLLTGKTGTGKTYLVSAMASQLLKQGKIVVFLTAYALNDVFLQYHLADVEHKREIMSSITDADVLVIDDLGTENVLKNVTMEYLFLVLNERQSLGKSTFVCTNLSPAELRDRYDDRIFDRLTDSRNVLFAELVGKDKRRSR